MIQRHCLSFMLHCYSASSTLGWLSLSLVKTTFGLVCSYRSNVENERVLTWAVAEETDRTDHKRVKTSASLSL